LQQNLQLQALVGDNGYMSPVNVSTIGSYIREQREQAKISLRQLAQAAGVSNPYLSQIERGLRRPSADILQQIAKGLRISAEALYVQAGFLEDKSPGSAVREAVLTDPELSERQKQMLIEIYESFRKESATVTVQGDTGDPDESALAWPGTLEPAGLARWAIAADPAHAAGAEAPPWADADADAAAGPWAGTDADAAAGSSPGAADDHPAAGRAPGTPAATPAAAAGQAGDRAEDQDAAARQFPSASGTR
jgi:transcriptional regulator with XRE-family HTH domain